VKDAPTVRPVYQVRAKRDGDFMFVSVRDVPGAIGQAKSESEVLDVAREVLSLLLNVPLDSFDLIRSHHWRWSEIKRNKGVPTDLP